MKTMTTIQLQVLLGILCAVAVIGLASPASGATLTYSYTSGGLKDASVWTLEKYAPASTGTDTWENTYSYTNNGTSFGFDSRTAVPYTVTTLYRGALVWMAPVNQVITKVEFSYTSGTDASKWQAVMYELARGEALDADTGILKALPAWDPAAQVYPFTEAYNLQGIGLGFNTNIELWREWYTEYTAITITTTVIPEPVTAGLLLLGGACLACVRRRRDSRG